jgi:hypothetical protein
VIAAFIKAWIFLSGAGLWAGFALAFNTFLRYLRYQSE